MPELVLHGWRRILHNQRALYIKRLLLFEPARHPLQRSVPAFPLAGPGPGPRRVATLRIARRDRGRWRPRQSSSESESGGVRGPRRATQWAKCPTTCRGIGWERVIPWLIIALRPRPARHRRVRVDASTDRGSRTSGHRGRRGPCAHGARVRRGRGVRGAMARGEQGSPRRAAAIAGRAGCASGTGHDAEVPTRSERRRPASRRRSQRSRGRASGARAVCRAPPAHDRRRRECAAGYSRRSGRTAGRAIRPLRVELTDRVVDRRRIEVEAAREPREERHQRGRQVDVGHQSMIATSTDEIAGR